MELEAMTPIQEFYKNSVIFITGSTGFLGQLLLEKLSRSCPHISTIYIMVRNKKGKDLATRVDEILGDVLFEKVAKECPDFRSKIVAIPGDCALENLGLSVEDRKMLTEKVSIVFHAAATVRFDENAKIAAHINMRGTEYILKLSKEMKNLKSFIHVSTLFANSPKKNLEEKFYSPAYEYERMMNIVNNLPPNVLDIVTPELLGDYPNTYTITKQIAESVVQTHGQGMPVGVFRPSIVISTYREPLICWINNFYGATGYAAGAGLGIIRVGEGCESNPAHMIPADMTVNFLIASAWDVSRQFTSDGDKYEMQIYNYDCGDENYITWYKFKETISEAGVRVGSIKCIWYYCFMIFSNHYVYLLMAFLLQTIPAALVDSVRFCIGKPPIMLKVYNKIGKFTKIMAYFFSNTWNISIDNYKRVCNSMTPEDKEIFFCDLKNLDWDEFLYNYLLGIRLYLIKDPIETLEEGKKWYRKLYWLHQTVKTVFILFFVYLLWSVYSLFYK